MKKSILVCLAALALMLAAPAAALARGTGDEQPREEVVARVKKALANKRSVRVTFKKEASWFKQEYTVTGKVGEVREDVFLFVPDDKADAAALKATGMDSVRYEDIASVHYPSKIKKFFKGVGIGAMGAGAFFIVMPVYGIEALLGQLPEC
jgi:hypothetical protein